MTTESKLYWGVGIFSVLVFAASFLLPGATEETGGMPWHIEHPEPGVSCVFGLTLGLSTAAEAEIIFSEEAKPSLFRSPAGHLVAEMFFEQVTLGGLKSKVVATIAVNGSELRAMYDRGLRVSGTGSGQKISLTPDDAARVRTLPISSLTYLPSVRLHDEVFAKRFGRPAQQIREKGSGVVHWLYPQEGLDIILGGEEKPVLQYVPPRDFDKLLLPLLENGEGIS